MTITTSSVLTDSSSGAFLRPSHRLRGHPGCGRWPTGITRTERLRMDMRQHVTPPCRHSRGADTERRDRRCVAKPGVGQRPAPRSAGRKLVLRLTTSSYLAGCPIGPSASRYCAYRGLQGGVEMPDQGSYCGPAQTVHSAQRGRAKAVRSPDGVDGAMIPSPLLRRAVVAALVALAITWPGMVSARAQAQPRDGSRTSPSGSYLAARHAGGQRDVAAAASYYRAALRGDPGNNELLGRTFVAVLANGEVDEGAKLAERVLQVDKHDRIARLVLGVRAIKQKQYPVARRELAQSISGPITDLAATLLSAWTMASPSEAKQATDSIDKLAGADWYAIFKDLHGALILDLAGQKREAAKRFERSHKLDPKALRVVQSYGSFLSRQAKTVDALKVLAAFDEVLPRHPLIVEATNELKAGKKLPLMVDTPQAGAAEVLYGLGAALGRQGGEDEGLIYLQLSLYLAPSHPLAL